VVVVSGKQKSITNRFQPRQRELETLRAKLTDPQRKRAARLDHDAIRRKERPDLVPWANSLLSEITWNRPGKGEGEGLMGNSQGRDNVRKRASRRKKTERLALAKAATAKKAKKK
jgi:hypothetical protein